MIEANTEDMLLQRVPGILYPVQFWKNWMQAIIDSESKINVMTPAYIVKLGLTIKKSDVSA